MGTTILLFVGFAMLNKSIYLLCGYPFFAVANVHFFSNASLHNCCKYPDISQLVFIAGKPVFEGIN